MGLRIELEEIWRRLQTRFKARTKTDTDPEDPDHPILIETLQPITNIDELLMEHKVAVVSGVAGTASGWVTFFTVPDGKRWHVKAVHAQRTTGDRTILIFGVDDKDGNSINIESFTAGSVYESGMLPSPLTLDEKAVIKYNFTAAGSSNGTWTGRALIAEEDAF